MQEGRYLATLWNKYCYTSSWFSPRKFHPIKSTHIYNNTGNGNRAFKLPVRRHCGKDPLKLQRYSLTQLFSATTQASSVMAHLSGYQVLCLKLIYCAYYFIAFPVYFKRSPCYTNSHISHMDDSYGTIVIIKIIILAYHVILKIGGVHQSVSRLSACKRLDPFASHILLFLSMKECLSCKQYKALNFLSQINSMYYFR